MQVKEDGAWQLHMAQLFVEKSKSPVWPYTQQSDCCAGWQNTTVPHHANTSLDYLQTHTPPCRAGIKAQADFNQGELNIQAWKVHIHSCCTSDSLLNHLKQ